MDSKILAGGVIGIGLLGVAGILILGGGSDDPQLHQMSSAESSQVDLDAGVSAYALQAPETEVTEVLEEQPRELQASRRDRGREQGPGGRFGRMEERLMEFDADGDGILDELERDAMAASMRQRMIDRFDADGDGMVSIEEQFAARRDFMLNSPRGQRMRDDFDADGDGELNEQELAAMNAEIDKREAERMAEIVSEYDTDLDGVMSPEETLAMQEQQFADRRSQMDQFAVQFDEDGDGNLNADERVEAMNTMIEQRELDRFLRRYDTNGDGEVGTSDYERFTEAYGNKEPYGDVNRDGIFNMDDVVMFRDMSERTNASDD